MKLFLLFVCCGAVVIIGFLFSNYYKKKLIVFSDLLKFCDVLKSEIKFKKSTINEIFKNNKHMFSKEFNDLVDICFNFVDYKEFNYLSKKEFKIVRNFMLALGKNDVVGEIENIDSRKILLQNYYDDLVIKNKSEGELAVKFSISCAVLIFIIFI